MTDRMIASRVHQIINEKIQSGLLGAALTRKQAERKVKTAKKKALTVQKRSTKVKRDTISTEKKLATALKRLEAAKLRKAKVSVSKKKAAKSNPWIAHVKKFAKSHNITYSEAITRAGPSYKKSKK